MLFIIVINMIQLRENSFSILFCKIDRQMAHHFILLKASKSFKF
jgi:hypothetical protein